MIVAHHNVESNKSFFQLPGGRGVIVYESLIGCQWLVYNTFAFWPQVPLELWTKHSLANSYMPLPKIKWITCWPMWHNHFFQYNARTMHCIHFCCSSLWKLLALKWQCRCGTRRNWSPWTTSQVIKQLQSLCQRPPLASLVNLGEVPDVCKMEDVI